MELIVILDLFLMVFFYGFDPMVNHHEKPPFGEHLLFFSKHLKQIQVILDYVRSQNPDISW